MLKAYNTALAFPTKAKRHFRNKASFDYSQRIPAYQSPRIMINVSGIHYETYEETLENYPNTLLGCPNQRLQFYDAVTGEYCFDRDRPSFDAILFFYQSRGILEKPDTVSETTFDEEVEFYGLKEEWQRILYGSTIPLETDHQVEPPPGTLRRKLFRCLEYPNSSVVARVFAVCCLVVIVFSTVSFCIETLPSLRIEPRTIRFNVTENGNETRTIERRETVVDYWFMIEGVCVGWFTLEYAFRLYASPSRLRFFRSLLGLLDLSAVLPFYLTLAISLNTADVRSFTVVRVIRTCRVLRVFKITRYSQAMRIVMRTVYDSSGQINTLVFTVAVATILFSSAIFYAESEQVYSSIPDAFWWTIITMTTVGYGDVFPTTVTGKIIGAMCAVTGVVIFCLPTPVLVSNFIKYYSSYGKLDNRKRVFVENLRKLFVRPKEFSFVYNQPWESTLNL